MAKAVGAADPRVPARVHRPAGVVERQRPQEVPVLGREAVVGDRRRPRAIEHLQLVLGQVAADVLDLEAGRAAEASELLRRVAARDRAVGTVGVAAERVVDVGAGNTSSTIMRSYAV